MSNAPDKEALLKILNANEEVSKVDHAQLQKSTEKKIKQQTVRDTSVKTGLYWRSDDLKKRFDRYIFDQKQSGKNISGSSFLNDLVEKFLHDAGY